MTITIQPIGAVGESALDEAMKCLGDELGLEVRLEQPLAEPSYAWDVRRGQFSSFEVLRALAQVPHDGSARLLGITECDLFIPALTFVFGQAQLDGRVALVSLARLRQQFYGMPEDSELFLARVRKEVLHETGHTLGLIHCPVPICSMRLSTSILQVDVKEDRLCDTCDQAVRQRMKRWKETGQ